jgi:DNA-binding PadR family transcriptional regulator
MGVLVSLGFVEAAPAPGNKKEKVYRITEKGETTFRFLADPVTNTLVKNMLEKP